MKNKYIALDTVENYKPSDSEYTHIEVRIEYVKWHGVILYIQEGTLKTDREFESFAFDLFGSNKARVIIEPMKRKNQKVITEVTEKFMNSHTDQEFINILNNYKK